MVWSDFRVILALVTHQPGVSFNRLLFIETHAASISLDETAIEDPTRQALVVIGFDRFEVTHRDARLIGNLAQSHASFLARESQLLTDSSCHHQSASP